MAANAAAAAIALVLDMSPRELLLVYWGQSLVICACTALRIFVMRPQESRDFHDGDVRPAPGVRARLGKAATFLLFWAFMHALFLVWIFWGRTIQYSLPVGMSLLGYSLALVAFAVHHGYSLLKNLRADAAGGHSDRDALFIIPFFRIFPMQVVAVVAALGGGGSAFALAFYAVMKTFADFFSHVLEHGMLQAPAHDRPYVS